MNRLLVGISLVASHQETATGNQNHFDSAVGGHDLRLRGCRGAWLGVRCRAIDFFTRTDYGQEACHEEALETGILHGVSFFAGIQSDSLLQAPSEVIMTDRFVVDASATPISQPRARAPTTSGMVPSIFLSGPRL